MISARRLARPVRRLSLLESCCSCRGGELDCCRSILWEAPITGDTSGEGIIAAMVVADHLEQCMRSRWCAKGLGSACSKYLRMGGRESFLVDDVRDFEVRG